MPNLGPWFLLAQIDPNSNSYRIGQVIGICVAGLLSGCIPMKMGQA